MKKTIIATAKIQEYYGHLIEQGVKRFEIRSDSLDGIDAIHLIGKETGRNIGTYKVTKTFCLNRNDDTKIMSLAQTTPEQFYDLFPPEINGGPAKLWIAEIGERISLDSLVALNGE